MNNLNNGKLKIYQTSVILFIMCLNESLRSTELDETLNECCLCTKFKLVIHVSVMNVITLELIKNLESILL